MSHRGNPVVWREGVNDATRCVAQRTAKRGGGRCLNEGAKYVPTAGGFVCGDHLSRGWSPHAPEAGVDPRVAAAQRRVLGEEE